LARTSQRGEIKGYTRSWMRLYLEVAFASFSKGGKKKGESRELTTAARRLDRSSN